MGSVGLFRFAPQASHPLSGPVGLPRHVLVMEMAGTTQDSKPSSTSAFQVPKHLAYKHISQSKAHGQVMDRASKSTPPMEVR